MSIRLIEYRNPGYGSVNKLCKALGYNSDDEIGVKNRREFRRKTADHRRDFMNCPSGITNFPLQYEAQQVQECVRAFMEKNSIEPVDYLEKWAP